MIARYVLITLGFYCPSGTTTLKPCPLAYYCPIGSAAGTFCPSGTTSFPASSQCFTPNGIIGLLFCVLISCRFIEIGLYGFVDMAVLSILVGQSAPTGSSDGVGTSASFSVPALPYSMNPLDSSIWVGYYHYQSVNPTELRRVSSFGSVTTVSLAFQLEPSSYTFDNRGNFYGQHNYKCWIFRIPSSSFPTNTVGLTVLAGSASTSSLSDGDAGSACTSLSSNLLDGAGNAAKFGKAWAIAADSSGTVFVGEMFVYLLNYMD
jgi:hypothetical protein